VNNRLLTPRRPPVLADAPPAVLDAWAAYLAAGGDPARYHTETRTFERAGLELVLWQELRRVGYFLVEGWAVGWVGPRGERRFAIRPRSRPLRPETHVERTWFHQIYGRDPYERLAPERAGVEPGPG
jgi:hypothetical protein